MLGRLGIPMPRVDTQSTYFFYLGIDPGKNGGLCCLRNDKVVLVRPMPDSLMELWRVMQGVSEVHLVEGQTVRAVIELVHTSPQMGVKSAGTFMQGYGTLLMALTAAGIPYEEVRPVVWQKALSIPPRKKGQKVPIKDPKTKKTKVVVKGAETDSQWKSRLLRKAQQLFPSLEIWKGPKYKQLAVADAVLIAEYCRRKHEGKL